MILGVKTEKVNQENSLKTNCTIEMFNMSNNPCIENYEVSLPFDLNDFVKHI